MRFLTFGILYTLVYLTAGFLLGGHPHARIIVADSLLIALLLAVCAVIFIRRREWEGAHLLFWDAAAVGYLLWCVGEVGFTITSVTEHRSWVQWHTMFSLCGGIGPVVALLARPHRGARKEAAWAIGLDQASYATLMGFVYAYFIMVPSVVPTDGRPSPQSTLLWLVQVQRLILFGGLAASAWFARATPWGRTFVALAGVTGIGFGLRWITSGAIDTGRYYEGSLYDLAWIVPFLGYLWAVLESPASADDTEATAPRGGWRSAMISAVPVLLIPTIGFGLLRAQPIGDPGDSMRLLLTILSMVAGLGLLTLRLSAQGGELQRADAQMRLLAAATEQTADLILITNSRGGFEHANDACMHALGYTRKELAGLGLPDLLDRSFARLVDHIGSEVRKRGIWRGTLMHRRKDGTVFPVSSTVVALRDGGGRVTHFVGVQRDITEELKLRDQLVHSERLSAVGELVAGVAHEINNPLQTIIGLAELMLEEPTASHAGDLQVVRQEASRAGQIVRSLLAFARKGSPDRTRADLNHIVRATAQLRERHLAQKDIALQLELSPGALPVLVNREEIQQVVLNLVLNAEHAIGDRPGTIVVHTEAGTQAHTVRVSDDGPGISPELRGRVFEPFFTTKDVGQGTGLGLSLGLGIARAHGGTLELLPESVPTPDSQFPKPKAQSRKPNRGASFQVTLPAAPGAGEDAATPAAGARISTGGRVALVIEDEKPVRDLLVRLLARRDYQVVVAASCREAKATGERQAFDLVLCDVRLEDGNGIECLRHLTARQPSLARRFVFVTGDGSALVGEDGELSGVPVLLKPFTAADLERALGDVDVVV